MMAKKRTRARYADSRKAQLVAQAMKTSATTVASKHDMHPGTISRWMRDPRYGGLSEIAPGTLPTVRRQARKARALVPTQFACPYCGGLIDKEA